MDRFDWGISQAKRLTAYGQIFYEYRIGALLLYTIPANRSVEIIFQKLKIIMFLACIYFVTIAWTAVHTV